MKQLLTFILLICGYVLCGAQATSLTVDNQTPGWLSSKINYGDQQTVENLKVTGFLNATDFAFIGTLIQNHSLTGSLDLEESQPVSSNGLVDNKIPSNIFAFESSNATKGLKKLIMPTNIVDYEEGWFGEYRFTIQIDSLIIGGPQLKLISSNTIPQYKSIVKHLVIRDGAESLSFDRISSSKPEQCISSIKCITVDLPSTMKKIDKYSFANAPLQSINLPESIEEIGEYAFLGCSCFKEESVVLPKSLKKLNINMFYKALPKTLFIGPNVSSIDNSYYYDNNSGGSWSSSVTGHAPVINGETINIFVFATTPMPISYEKGLSQAIIHVPQKCMNAYKSHYSWSKLNIDGFTIPNDIKCQIPNYLYVGDNVALENDGVGGETIPLVWNCGNNECVEIVNNRLYCKQYGEATISGSYLYQDSKTDFMLNIYEHTNGLQMPQRELELHVGETLQVYAQTLPLGKSDGRIIWESEDETVASISNDGILMAKKAGSVYITAKSIDGGYSKDCRVSITNKDVKIQSISINPPSKSLTVGESFKLEIEILPINATERTISWTSTNSNVVSITSDGLITALSAGSAQIIATTTDGSNLSAICDITVEKQFVYVSDLQITPASKRLAIGETFPLDVIIKPSDATNKAVVWSSTNPGVASVSKDGLVTAVSEGEAIIIASSQDGSNLSSTCNVTVYNNVILVSSIALDKEVVNGYPNETIRLTASVLPENASNKALVWNSTNPSVADIDNNGLLTLLQKGSANITAASTDGSKIKAHCAVFVSGMSGIDSVITDKSASVKIYNSTGILVFDGVYSEANLTPGIYIILYNGERFKAKL